MFMLTSVTTFAEEKDSIKYLPSDVKEITEEIIDEYGIVSIDEDGNEIITIPLGPSDSESNIETPYHNFDDTIHDVIHEGHKIPDNIPIPRHYDILVHTHEVINVRSYILNSYAPVTHFADQGFTITKEYSKSAEISVAVNLVGGITKNIVEHSLGITIEKSYSQGSNESYSRTVPNGYKGRIVYYYSSTVYNFTNKTTYYWPEGGFFYHYDECTVQSAPRNGYFGLQLIAR